MCVRLGGSVYVCVCVCVCVFVLYDFKMETVAAKGRGLANVSVGVLPALTRFN